MQLGSGDSITLLGAKPPGQPPTMTCKLHSGKFAFRFERACTPAMVDASQDRLSQRVSGRHAVLRYEQALIVWC